MKMTRMTNPALTIRGIAWAASVSQLTLGMLFHTIVSSTAAVNTAATARLLNALISWSATAWTLLWIGQQMNGLPASRFK
jgi:hypothetical protein